MNRLPGYLQIADVVFSLCNDDAVVEEIERVDAGPPYSSFARALRPEGASFYCDARITSGDDESMWVETPGAKLLFEGFPLWGLFETSQGYRVAFRYREDPGRRMIADIRGDWRRVDIRCGSAYLIRSKPSVRLANPMRYPLDQILLMHILAREGGVILHAAGVGFRGRAYLFAGVSGAGKSTITELLTAMPEIEPLNDDRVIVRKKGTGFVAYGTPWPGEKRIARDFCMPLGGIFFIVKGTENRIRRLTAGEALKRLMPVASVPWYHKELTARVLDFCGEIISGVKMYEFSFCRDATAVDSFLEQGALFEEPNG